jgi:hypothetical protein
VPEYRRFSGEAKEVPAKLAWKTAQEVVRETLPENAGLAVGLKGVVLYGAVMIGRVGKSDGEAVEPDGTGSEKKRPVPFFERSAQSEPVAPPAAAPSDSVKPDEILLEQPDAPSPAPKTGG